MSASAGDIARAIHSRPHAEMAQESGKERHHRECAPCEGWPQGCDRVACFLHEGDRAVRDPGYMLDKITGNLDCRNSRSMTGVDGACLACREIAVEGTGSEAAGRAWVDSVCIACWLRLEVRLAVLVVTLKV